MLELQRKQAEVLESEYNQLLESTDLADREAWHSSPCTTALRNKLSQLLLDIQVNWSLGSYTTESGDGTLQKNSKQIGMVQALQDALEEIDQIKEPLIKDEDGKAE